MAKPHRGVAWLLFFLIFLLELATGYYVAHIKGFFYGDAISRVANSFYVLYTNPPHLAAIGGVWNPLPSLCELPFMLLWPVYKPIAASGLAGVIFSSAFAAGSAVLIYRAAAHFGLATATGVSLALLYSLNPFIFIYGFNGMTEVPFSFMLLWLIFSFTHWLEERTPYHLIMMALALMLALLIRYETIPVSVVAFVAVSVITLTVHRKRFAAQGVKGKWVWQRLEGESIVLLTPVLYAFLVWVLFCWIVLGNALYFMNSDYSITAFAGEYASNTILKNLVGHPWQVCQFIFYKTRLFLIPLIIILWFRLWKRNLWKWDFLILLLFLLSTNILQFVSLLKGLSAGWLRYFLYPFPFLTAWLPYELKQVNSKVFSVLCIIFLVCTDLAMGFALFDPSPNRVGGEELNNLSFPADKKDIAQQEVAQYINTRLSHATILMDCVKTYLVIMNTKRPQNLVISSCYQFHAAVRNPQRHHIEYVLIPSTTVSDPFFMDAVNKRYPTLYRDGADWCVPEKRFGEYYTLYQVKLNKVENHKSIPPIPRAVVNTSVVPNPTPVQNQENTGLPIYSPIEPGKKGGAPSAFSHASTAADYPTPPDLSEAYWEGVISTATEQIVLIEYHGAHYSLHLGECLPGTPYILEKLYKDSAALSAQGKLHFIYKKIANNDS